MNELGKTGRLASLGSEEGVPRLAERNGRLVVELDRDSVRALIRLVKYFHDDYRYTDEKGDHPEYHIPECKEILRARKVVVKIARTGLLRRADPCPDEDPLEAAIRAMAACDVGYGCDHE